MGKRISAIVLTRNSKESIFRALQSLRWVDEIIVIDDHSTDETLQIAQRNGARIYQHSLDENFAKQRNFALSKVMTEWAFFVDADEQVSQTLASEIGKKLDDTRYNGYFIRRVDIWNKKELRFGEFLNFSLLRLGRVGKGKWEGTVHETWEIPGAVGELRSPLFHHSAGVGKFLEKINFYSSLRAKQLYEMKSMPNFFTILLFPPAKFLVNYLFRFGFLDGTAGMVSAMGMSFYTFLVRAKLWFLWNDSTKKI